MEQKEFEAILPNTVRVGGHLAKGWVARRRLLFINSSLSMESGRVSPASQLTKENATMQDFHNACKQPTWACPSPSCVLPSCIFSIPLPLSIGHITHTDLSHKACIVWKGRGCKSADTLPALMAPGRSLDTFSCPLGTSSTSPD